MLKNVFIFVAGAFAGTVVGARLVKKRYEEIANEEIEEIREYYKNKDKEIQEKEEELEERENKVDKKEYEQIANAYKVDPSMVYLKAEPTEEESKNEQLEEYGKSLCKKMEDYEKNFNDPYPIDPSEFGNGGYYGTETYTYFADGVLVDPDDDVVEDWMDIVGDHHVHIFEEFPDATSVYIRNDFDGIDYEILKDDWCWSDFEEPEKKPHQL